MALSGLEIYKLLPKTNCRKCGYSTCLAFAMALAKKQVPLDKCEFVKPEVKEVLQEASLAPMRTVTLGTGEHAIAVGGETVLFRHEERFHHPSAVGFVIDDSHKLSEIESQVRMINSFQFERVGEMICANCIAVRHTRDAANFVEKITKVCELSVFPLVLMSEDAAALTAALEVCALKKPLVYAANEANSDALIAAAKKFDVALAVRAKDFEGLQTLAQKALQAGVRDIIIEPIIDNSADVMGQYTYLRRLVLKKKKRGLGFPVLSVVQEEDPMQEAIAAASYIAKYSSVVLVRTVDPWHILSLLTLRQNIFTDPQKPLQVEPNIYSVGQVDEHSPVMLTTNFSLTYYTVLGEVEASKMPAYIVSVDTEGMSVLTAWAAEKFTPEKISQTLEQFDVKQKVSHNKLILPGYVSVMSGDLEDKSGWQVCVGPKEASGLTSFLKTYK